MKKILLLIFLGGISIIFAQNDCIEDVDLQNSPTPCCNPIISTGFPNPTNTDYPALLNQFDWLAPTVVHPNVQMIEINYGGNQVEAQHPFLNDLTKYRWYSNFRTGPFFETDTHNMHPKYGWELLHNNFGLGLFNNASPQQTQGRFNPYMIFYNKYDGKLRAFFSPGQGNTFDETNVDLKIPYFPNDITRNLSAIFNHYNSKSRALDKETEIDLVSSFLPFANPSNWSAADFQLAYDPCVCNHESRIEFKFTERNFSDVEMIGRLVGTNVPLNTSGNSPLNFGDDFLSSVWATNSDFEQMKAETGMLVYNQIADDVQSAYVTPQMKALSKLFNLVASAGLIKGIKLPLPQAIKDEFPKLKDKKLPVGSAITSLAKYGHKNITNSAPNITYLEAEGVFTGLITDDSNSGGLADIELTQPGSYHPFRLNLPWTLHPFYNEAPGLLALLETPEVEFVVYRNYSTIENSQIIVSLKDPIKYTLNPAAEIDLDETEIYAQLEFDLYQDPNVNGGGICSDSIPFENYSVGALDNIIDIDDFLPQFYFSEINSDCKRTIQTPLLPIDKLSEYVFKLEKNQIPVLFVSEQLPINLRINIVADFVFLENKYGIVNRVPHLFSYEVKETNLTPSASIYDCDLPFFNASFCDKINYGEIANAYSENITIGTTNFTSDTTIFGNNITIIGNITTSNNAIVNIYAASEINFAFGSISPEVNLEIRDIFEHEELNPVSDLFVKNFCNSNTYKANQPSAKVLLAAQNDFYVEEANSEEVDKNPLHANYKIYPNPTQGNLRFDLATEFDANISVAIYDLSGREIKRYVSNENWQQGIHQKVYDISNLSDGVYLFKFCINENCFNEKVVKTK